jgi:hypothetical protein
MATRIKDNAAQMAVPPPNPDEYVYRPRKTEAGFDEVPATIYFYFVTKASGSWSVKHYFYVHGRDPITDVSPHSDLEERVRLLARNAQNNGNNPPQCGANWEYIVWNHESYFVILIDDPTVKFDQNNAIEFDLLKNGTPNHSFFDGREFTVPLPDQAGVTQAFPAFCCINHMKRNEAGNDLGDYPEYFHFVPHTSPTLRSLGILEFTDSGGTNMGPPSPPPGMPALMGTPDPQLSVEPQNEEET